MTPMTHFISIRYLDTSLSMRYGTTSMKLKITHFTNKTQPYQSGSHRKKLRLIMVIKDIWVIWSFMTLREVIWEQ